ncbi:sensor histidine kinase [Kitasatospora azatica]|uniref:sensor histidine kinase n=1 Tax=Kitasatospora azatica TaxID=58347 RepID=UPI000566635B|nr:HAMP domain-containing sensor histidine kinase [Kitasatospora azatica]
MQLWHRISVRTRAAIGAALAAALAFGLAAVWVGQAAYDQWLPTARANALHDATALDEVATTPLAPADYRQSAYVLVLADGSWAQHDRISGRTTGFLPPLPQTSPGGFSDTVTLRLPADVGYQVSTPVGPNPTDRTVTFVRRIGGMALSSAQLNELTGRPELFAGPGSSSGGRTDLPAQRITTFVLVNTVEAHLAQDRVSRLLGWYLAPAACLFVAAMAWLVTGLALRPVEGIRRGMARIGNGAFHERVPVPPARDGIARLAETTNATLERLERALDEQRRLVADASHELRSPLAALRSALEVPLTHPQDVAWPSVVESALTDTERLQDLADDLLLLARTDQDRGVEVGGVELHDLVAEQLAERALTDPGLLFRSSAQEATVRGRELLIGRVLRNLLDNAARHAAAEVTVTLEAAEGWAVLTVADDGPGIPAADRDRVFDRFVRLDTDRNRRAGGAGLGLALVRTIARSLGGAATAEEPPDGRGARLVVRLPLVG